MDGVSFLLGFLVAVSAGLWVVVVRQLLSTRRGRLALAADHCAPTADSIKRVFRGGESLPFWLSNPEVIDSNPEFINTALQLLWKRIDRAGVEWAFKDQNLEHMMNAEDCWKPAWMKATGIVLQALSLGHVPPTVSGVKVYRHASKSAKGGIVMDCSFAWKSAMQVQIAMKTLDSVDAMTIVDRLLSCVYRAVTVTAVVRNLIARGKIRITCSPLLDSLPVVGGVHISFLEPPRISYDVSSFGANPLLVPGLESWLRSFVEEQAMDPFTYPDGVTVDVAKLFGATCDTHQMPVGLLCVTVISARGVPKTDIFGLSDPYAKIWIEKSKKQTTTVRSNTLSPVWDEEFDMLVYDLEHQRLNVQLYDSEAIGGDVLIGEAAVPLKSVDWDANMSVELTVPIEVVYGKGRKQGRNEVVRGSNGVNGGGAPAFENRAFSSATSGASDLLPRRSSTFDGFDELKGAVKGAFRGTKACTVRLKLDYLAFEAPPADHVDDDGSDTGEDTGEAEPGDRRSPSAAANTAALSARAQRFLNGGFLHVHISRALNLQSSAQLTKKFKLVIRVVRGDEIVISREHSRNGLSKSNSSVNPVFDISTDLLLDSETANDPEANLEVEILVDHFVKRSSSRGKAVIPICDILEEGRIHSRYKLRKVDQRRAGEVELTLVYTSTV